MTINLALLTSDAVVLGCDSIASQSTYLVDPLAIIQRGPDGDFLRDEQGRYLAAVESGHFQRLVTNAWGGVQKMYCICDDRGTGISVGAVTTGIATLESRSIASHVAEFRGIQDRSEAKAATVAEIAGRFLAHFRPLFESTFGATPPAFRSELQFLLAGFGRGDSFPSLHRINVAENRDDVVFDGTQRSTPGIAWGGQSIAVNRMVSGIDIDLRQEIDAAIRKHTIEVHAQIASIISETLANLGAVAPDGVLGELPAPPRIDDLVDRYGLSIDYANLPLQAGVDLVSFLVNLESGRQKFLSGVPTVGGRTHIGVITTQEGYRLLNEPDLTHENIGFSREI